MLVQGAAGVSYSTSGACCTKLLLWLCSVSGTCCSKIDALLVHHQQYMLLEPSCCDCDSCATASSPATAPSPRRASRCACTACCLAPTSPSPQVRLAWLTSCSAQCSLMRGCRRICDSSTRGCSPLLLDPAECCQIVIEHHSRRRQGPSLRRLCGGARPGARNQGRACALTVSHCLTHRMPF